MNQSKKAWLSIEKTLICIGLALFLVGASMPSGLVRAGGWVKPEMVFPEHYPYGFHGMGTIYSIAGDKVVIDDEGFTLAPSVEYHTLNIENASNALFQPGKKVGGFTVGAVPDAFGLVDNRRVPEDEVLPPVGGAVLGNDGEGQPRQLLRMLTGVGDGRRAADELGV